tara:strand:+ start:1693 stop:3096 length:1404 start_codon:yes stop_codon:yes gene_type:complete
MGILNQLLVRFPKWIVSWVLVFIDTIIGYYVISNVLLDIPIDLLGTSIFSIFITLQICWCFVFWAANLYNGDAEVSRFGETETLIKLTFIIMTAGIFLLGIDIDLGPVKSQYIIRYWILFSLLAILNRWLIRSVQKYLLKKGFGQHNVIVIGSGDRSKFVTEKLYNHRQKLYRVIGYIKTNGESKHNESATATLLGKEKDLKNIIANNPVSDIVIALDDMEHDHILKLISIINGTPVSIKIVPNLYEVISGLARTEQISGLPLIEVNFQQNKWSGSGMKRMFDFLMSFILLLSLFPIFILIGIIIKINSKGPIIYSQERLGYNGQPFNIYKLRSMVADAEQESGPVWTLDDDPRITSFGQMLRKYRIDEFPQLINVFLGQMSLIGPRPERPYFIERLKGKFPLYERRFRVRPGITGWSQIKHPSDTKEEDVRQKLRYDFYYIENLSFNLDLKIFISTIAVVLSGRGR